jgi:membrane-bound lytic murein transglycosylase F
MAAGKCLFSIMARPLLKRVVLCTGILVGGCVTDKENFATEPKVIVDIAQILERGYLNALIDNNSVSYFIYRGEPLGYEYELLKRLSERLKVDLKITIISGVEDAIDRLNRGEGDIIAFPLTITSERRQWIDFTDTHFTTSQVLVQKKPAGWEDNPDLVEDSLIRNPAGLLGKEVYVMKQSSFVERLRNLSTELGGEIIVLEDSSGAETESLIRQVQSGQIKYTVADQTFGLVNATYYPDLDVKTVLSAPQQIAWALRQNSPALRDSINAWMSDLKGSGRFKIIYDKYFNSLKTTRKRMQSEYYSVAGESLSKYDDIIKESAAAVGMDWRLVASVTYQESAFNPRVESWAGAMGLMQLMPATVQQFKVVNVMDPRENIQAGVKVLKHLDGIWSRTVSDTTQRIKFVLASYNAGLSHVADARNLARKYGKDPSRWDDNVEDYMQLLTNSKYYRDAVVAAGYCRCEFPVRYVKEVLGRYEDYKLHFPDHDSSL